ncbi:MAG: maltose alpha-D-glucosyltransferase [Acidimicrobiia bacterium]
MTTTPEATSWYKDAIVYQLHVRSYRDSDGDGIGDFVGLTRKLDYIEELGVTAIWLLPFYPSPLRDDGYDISDYTGINSAYGDLRSFRRFLNEAHRRGLRVITELVMNHTSDQHAWFQRARRAPRGSRWRDYYVWSDSPDHYLDARIIFQDFETSNWTYDPVADAYYWHRFYSHQPDLNFDNPMVRREMLRILDMWFSMGVDGMRLDAVPYLYEREGTNCENLPETHAFLRDVRSYMADRFPDRMLLAEANQWPEDAAQYFGTEDAPECHMCFHFPLMPRLYTALRQENRLPIADILEQTPAIPSTAQWAIFLRNHDELTLEMVTDEERIGMYRAYAQDPQMRVNLGIRRRLAPLLQNDRRKIELLNSLLFSLPGTPIIYYGDEIGMGDNIYLGDRNAVRTPMQWSPDRNAGFSGTNPQQLFLPLIIDADYHYETVNVETMSRNPSSLLWWTRRMIALRNQHRAFGRGRIDFLDPDNHKVLAFVRTAPETDDVDDVILVLANLSRHAQSVQVDLSQFNGRKPIELFGGTSFAQIGELPYYVTLGPYGVYWFRLEPQEQSAPVPSRSNLPTIDFDDDWRDVLTSRSARRLQTPFSRYLVQQRWFSGKARDITSVSVADVVSVSREDVIAVVNVDYAEGDPDAFALPLTAVTIDLDADPPFGALALLRPSGSGDADTLYALVEASGEQRLARTLLSAVVRRRTLGTEAGLITPQRVAKQAARVRDAVDAPVRVMSAEQSNTSAVFENQVVMKLFRKLEAGPNPDAEVGTYLSDHQEFDHTAPLVGALNYKARGRNGDSRTLAVFHRFVPNEGDAWRFTLDELGRFLEHVLAFGDGPDFAQLCPADLLAPGEPSTVVRETMDPYLQSMRCLGTRIGELHLTLAAGETPEFAPERFTRLYQRSLFESFRTQAKATFRLLRHQQSELNERAIEPAARVLDRQDEILGQFDAMRNEPLNSLRIRTHGDMHLGQILYTGQDFVIIDFEGEPSRPLGERRIKRSPLRDVAGVLRSLQYAGAAAIDAAAERGLVPPGSAAQMRLRQWTSLWRAWAQAELLGSYFAVAAPPLVPDDDHALRVLLQAYLLDKALYEVRYELGSRPAWVWVPLDGVLDLLSNPLSPGGAPC